MDIQQMADRLYAVKQQISAANEEVKSLNKVKAQYESELIERLDKLNLDQIRTDDATFTLKEEAIPKAEDWDAISAWIIENDAVHLLQRRISTVPYRELIEMGETIPGISTFSKKSILTRSR